MMMLSMAIGGGTHGLKFPGDCPHGLDDDVHDVDALRDAMGKAQLASR